MSDVEMIDDKMTSALMAFFTAPVLLPESASGAVVGDVWWEEHGELRYPWRVTGYRQGYPCGEPKKK